MLKKEDIENVVKLFNERNISRLENYEFVLWLSWLDQRTAFREFRIVEVEEDFKVLCVYGIRIVINGKEFINMIAGIEIADKYFVSVDSATPDDWKTFLERIVEEERPRIIPAYSFRKRIGLPDSTSLYEVYILSIDKRG
ncbi:MAG: hypothetical protein Q6363_006250 [Candidatus Njordarchaeota archaeon]